MMSCVNR